MRMIIVLFLVFSFTAVSDVYLQEQVEEQNTPKTQPKKADYPWYWNRPYENIDNFENSSLGKKRSSVTRGYKDSETQGDNIEINKKIEEDIQKNREKQQKFELGYSSSPGLSVDADGSVVGTTAVGEVQTIGGTLSNKKTITWVDENGVVHVTNDPTEVYKRSK